jgi:hypothetical protein
LLIRPNPTNMKTSIQILLTVCLLACLHSNAQVPIYNSYPSASATVFLDFDGHRVDGTSWNGSGPIDCGPSNLTTSQITEVFNRVAEDYRPFNINITTDSTKYWSAPAYKRMRVIFTISSSWYGSAGGVSFLGSFTWGDNTPCFVFTALLGYSSKKSAEAGSHEIGHTLGLNHQSSYDASCNKTAEYNPGAGSGEIGWAPIMGNSYSRNMTLWHNGSNPYGCTNFQDDLGTITGGVNGFGYRTDDHAETSVSATTLNFTNNQSAASGVIERITDKDVFKFTIASQGNFHLDASPYSIATANAGSNLDMQVELLNSSFNLLKTYNPDNSLNTTIDTLLPAGTYYLRIQGKGNVYAPEYASLGSYNLSASFAPSTTLPLYRLELAGTAENNRHKLNWIIEADENVTKQILEVSTNGIQYQAVASPANSLRSYQHVPGGGNILYYRLFVEFDNHTQYYSNVVSLRNTTKTGRPNLAGNLVINNLSVNSPEVFNYSIVDLNGRIVLKGKLMQGTSQINTSYLSQGMYLIQFNNGLDQFVERFVKQ